MQRSSYGYLGYICTKINKTTQIMTQKTKYVIAYLMVTILIAVIIRFIIEMGWLSRTSGVIVFIIIVASDLIGRYTRKRVEKKKTCEEQSDLPR